MNPDYSKLWVSILLTTFLIAGLSIPGFPKNNAESQSSNQRNEDQKQTAFSPDNGRAAESFKIPDFQNIRSDEDWSVLKHSARNTGYEKLKFIPLNRSGSIFLSLGGQLRLRAESWNHFGFGGPGNRDDTYGLMRIRMHGDLRLGTRLRIFAEGKSSLVTGRNLPGGLRTLDVDSIDIQNMMLDVNLSLDPTASTLRLGRQELQFGKQRLVSPLDWSNTRRTWDAARLIVKSDNWRVDGFWSK